MCGFAGVIVHSFQNTQVPSKQLKVTTHLESMAAEDTSQSQATQAAGALPRNRSLPGARHPDSSF